MPTYTPMHRSGEVTEAAMIDGMISGTLALIPSGGAVWLALQRSPKFVKSTNWQSRTALVIMPALFAFGFASESTLNHRMQEMAQVSEHKQDVAEWVHRYEKDRMEQGKSKLPLTSDIHLSTLYRQSVEQSGVRVVPGDSLGIHHQMANYWQAHPFKILVGVGVPTVGYIFFGRAGQAHLPLQMKIMHTRVMGQFAVIGTLLTLMGFKEYMDRNGKFITEADAEARVEEMQQVRAQLVARMQMDKEAQQARLHELEEAHEQDVKEGHVHDRQHKNSYQQTDMGSVVATTPSQP